MNEKDDRLIDAYLRGVLTAEDEVLLKQQLRDKDFKQKYDEATFLLQVLKEEDAKRMKSKLQSIEAIENVPNKANKTNSLKLALSVFALILVAIAYFLLFSKSDNRQAIYASYYEPYPNVIDPIVKGGTDSLSIFQHYELKDYKKVIQTLNSNSTLTPDQQFYLASAYLEESNFEKASELFEKLKNSEKYSGPSHWYLALICVNRHNYTCKKMFDTIALDKSNIYNNKAKELLKRIRK